MYKIMGYKPKPVEQNPVNPAPLEEVVLYETDDRDEAQRLYAAGGYIDSHDRYCPISRMVYAGAGTEAVIADSFLSKTSVNTVDSSGTPENELRSKDNSIKKGEV